MELLKQLFQNKQKNVKNQLNVPAEALLPYLRTNRLSLEKVTDWVDEDALKQSVFDYGVPDFIRPLLNRPIGDALTYTDIMSYIANRYFPDLSYLEIGVSVGKNFFQMLESCQRGRFVGFDIEEIYPVLARFLDVQSREEWPSLAGPT